MLISCRLRGRSARTIISAIRAFNATHLLSTGSYMACRHDKKLLHLTQKQAGNYGCLIPIKAILFPVVLRVDLHGMKMATTKEFLFVYATVFFLLMRKLENLSNILATVDM